MNVLLANLVSSVMLDALADVKEKRRAIRILEVGGGTGATTESLLSSLSSLEINYQYTFTDISPLFISEARKRFGEKQRVHYQLFNIEMDPLGQGFQPGFFDFVIGFQVIHATRDLRNTLTNLNTVLRPGGVILLSEQFGNVPLITVPFGLLDGWWAFEDERICGPIQNGAGWKLALEDTGFNEVYTQAVFEENGGIISAKKHTSMPSTKQTEKSWIVFHDGTQLATQLRSRLEFNGRNVISVDRKLGGNGNLDENGFVALDPMNPAQLSSFLASILDSKTTIEGISYFYTLHDLETPISTIQEQVAGGLLSLCQALVAHSSKMRIKPKITLITRGLHYIGDADIGNPNGASCWGLLKSFVNENPEFPSLFIDLDASVGCPVVESEDIYINLWNSGTSSNSEMFLALRDGKTYNQRFTAFEKCRNIIALPQSSRFDFINPSTKTFGDIQFGPVGKSELRDDNVEVQIHATGLNFRDLFMVLRPEGFILPEGQPMEVGLDVAGTVTALGSKVTDLSIGDAVFGFTLYGGLRSHVTVPSYSLMKKPAGMTFTGAATVPCAFLTAFYSLVHVAKICAKDRVLIHVASGGVGLAAIQIAQNAGAEIYATAGSRRKRAYLRSLGIKNIYHSRNTEFGGGFRKIPKVKA